jgi:uncharacterized membrane protein YhaH (DUF805 family)
MTTNEIKKLFTLNGTSKRSEYWAVNLVCYFMLVIAGLVSAFMMELGFIGFVFVLPLMLTVFVITTFLIISVTIKRCRDIGISPWFTLSLAIPYIGIIPFIVFGCLKSENTNE